jgi:hypothetical protein
MELVIFQPILNETANRGELFENQDASSERAHTAEHLSSSCFLSLEIFVSDVR